MADERVGGSTTEGAGHRIGLPVQEVEGFLMPQFLDNILRRPVKEHIDHVRAMDMRDDDVILCSYPKSGTHWLWEVGCMLLAGKAEYEKRDKRHMMMEFTDVEKMQALPSPRLFNTHFPLSMLPGQVKANKKVKVIHVYRNPKDVVVSLYFHTRQMKMVQGITIDSTANTVLSEKLMSGVYFDYLKEMDSFIKDNPDIPVFNMSFEEMKEDPKGMVRKLAKFLQVEASEELCDAIADACSFHKLKVIEETKEDPESFRKENLKLYRKGEVGDWKNHLTVAISERIDKAMETLQGCDFRFRFS